MTAHRRIVVGLGNELLTDDGVGVHAVRALASEAGAAAHCWEIGTAIWHLTTVLQSGDHVLAIDSVAHDGAPGSIYYLEGPDAACMHRASGVHGLGLVEVLPMIEPARRPARVAVLGVQPASLDYGMQLSSRVAQALPRLVAVALAWLAGTPFSAFDGEYITTKTPRHAAASLSLASAWCSAHPPVVQR